MKRIIAIIAVVFTASLATAQNQPERYMFTGTLNSLPTANADCGNMSNAAVYEFTVSMISDNSYTEQNIAIIVKCPETFGADFFKVGSTYKMEIFDAPDGTYTIVNPGVLDNYTLPHNYWAGDMKRLQ